MTPAPRRPVDASRRVLGGSPPYGRREAFSGASTARATAAA